MKVKNLLGGFQLLFVAFGALILVPLLTGLDPSVALFTSGVGTLAFQFITKRSVPVFLASSFVFVAPITHGINTWGLPATLCGLIAAGLVYIIIGLCIYFKGKDIVQCIAPPIVVGPIILLIGLLLAPIASSLAMGKSCDGTTQVYELPYALFLSALTLISACFFCINKNKNLRSLSLLLGLAIGYTAALLMGLVDFSSISCSDWFSVPNFTFPEWNLNAVLFILPIAIAPALEHFGDILAIGNVTGKDYTKDPGLHKTLIGDGVATSIASCFGGPPNTTYSEVTGAIAVTKMDDPKIITITAIIAIILSFMDKFGYLIKSIPTPILGGMLFLLFGVITTVGINTTCNNNDDLTSPRNIVIVGLILTFGIGGFQVSLGNTMLSGIGLASLIGLLLNYILPKEKDDDGKENRDSCINR